MQKAFCIISSCYLLILNVLIPSRLPLDNINIMYCPETALFAIGILNPLARAVERGERGFGNRGIWQQEFRDGCDIRVVASGSMPSLSEKPTNKSCLALLYSASYICH